MTRNPSRTKHHRKRFLPPVEMTHHSFGLFMKQCIASVITQIVYGFMNGKTAMWK